MFSDTHFHFHHMCTERNENGADLLSKMAAYDCKFGLDIGTHCDDLEERVKLAETELSKIQDPLLVQKIRSFLYFSAGIWPDVSAIIDRKHQIQILEENVKKSLNAESAGGLPKIVALGEFGLDHHWNPSGVDGRCESSFNDEVYAGEQELFEMQLDMAKRYNLPCIIHSRDAFEGTLDCIKNVGWHKGIIHCYSYGAAEAEKFLELGWYISFAGGVTYTKKAKMDEMHTLLNMVPEDRILCETDAPYLAPVPFRGQSNTPLLVEHTYRFVAEHRNTTPEELSNLVDKNIRNLFF